MRPAAPRTRSMRLALLVVAVALLAVPLPFVAAAPMAPVAPVSSPVVSHHVPSVAPGRVALPGSDPSHEPYIDAPALALQQWQAEQGLRRSSPAPVAPAPP
ncbi:MAG: hypothetical protein L3J73_02545, partial [Thermoplasmata archaeon]|nr:hypothetical protein [Thermoplasmata archaeon]